MSQISTVTREATSADQALFTSVRSPTGEGYRIIAASVNVSRQERAEILRRAPSHASLCSEEPNTVAMLAFPLTSGRTCVGLCQYAGMEHTARGGNRVHTHFALLDEQSYRLFENHALAVHAALNAVIGGRPQLKPEPTLEKLSLSIASIGPLHGQFQCGDPRRTESVLQTSLAMLQGQRLLVVDQEEGFDLLDLTLTCLPAVVRRCLAVSAGLKFSLSRRLQLSVVAPDQGQSRRVLFGQQVGWLDAENPSQRPASAYGPWLDFLKRRLEAGRVTEIRRLTAAITEDVDAQALGRIAGLCDDIDAAVCADGDELARLVSKYDQFSPASDVETQLLQQFQDAAERRPTPGARMEKS